MTKRGIRRNVENGRQTISFSEAPGLLIQSFMSQSYIIIVIALLFSAFTCSYLFIFLLVKAILTTVSCEYANKFLYIIIGHSLPSISSIQDNN